MWKSEYGQETKMFEIQIRVTKKCSYRHSIWAQSMCEVSAAVSAWCLDFIKIFRKPGHSKRGWKEMGNEEPTLGSPMSGHRSAIILQMS